MLPSEDGGNNDQLPSLQLLERSRIDLLGPLPILGDRAMNFPDVTDETRDTETDREDPLLVFFIGQCESNRKITEGI